MIKCDKGCGKAFNPEVRQGKVEGVKENLYIDYFTCPHCNKVYRAKLHNDKTLYLLDKYCKYREKLIKMKKEGKIITKQHEKELFKREKSFDIEMENLKKKYQGEFTV